MRLTFAEFIRLLRNVGYYLNPGFALFICLPLPEPLSYSTAAGVFAVASVGMITGIGYSRKPTSLRRLLLFIDGTYLSFAILLPIMHARVVSITSLSGWLTEYATGIALLFVITFLAVLSPWRIWRRRRVMVESLVTDGGILAEDVYNGLIALNPKGDWTQAQVTKATLAASAPFVAAGMAGAKGFEYVLFAGFLLIVAVAAIAAAGTIARRAYLFRNLPVDLYIIDPPVQQESVFWRHRMTDNYRSLSKLARLGLYSELAVFVIFSLTVALAGGSWWTPVFAVCFWSLGLLLILADNKDDDPRARSATLGWWIVHLPLLFLGSFLVIALLTWLVE